MLLEEYDKICKEFALPFLHKKAGQIANVILRLHTAIEAKESKENINQYINEIKEITAWAAEDSPMRPFFDHLVAFEEQFATTGRTER